METPIKIAIVEDTDIIRESMFALINGSPGFTCMQAYSNGEDACVNLTLDCADVVLMDINLPVKNGIECVRELKLKCTQTQFMMCTIYEDDDNIFEALKAGASSYMLKKTPPAKLLEAIKELHEGGAPMSSQIARRVVASMQQPAKKNDVLLSEREKEILDNLSRGLRYKEIANQLNISTETVRRHVHNIYEKLHVQSRTEAINKVYR